MSGAITEIKDHVWTVGGRRVYVVDHKTVIPGNPSLGDTVEAEGLKTPDGAIIANTVAKR